MKKELGIIAIFIISLILAHIVGSVIIYADGKLEVRTDSINTMLSKVTKHDIPPIQINLLPTKQPGNPTVPSPAAGPQIDKSSLALCLSRQGFTMYGTPWCPSCALERSYFGESFHFVREVNCDEQASVCSDKHISGYPTWEDSAGKQYRGAIPLEKLAEISGCL